MSIRPVPDPLPSAPDPWRADLAKALADVKAKLAASGSSARAPLFGTDATELLLAEFPPTSWQVTGLVTKGGTAIIAGEPKAGIKTWLLIEGALAVATGTRLCGEFSTEKGTVVIFFAEDPAQSIRNRVRALLAGAGRTLEPGRLHLQPRGEFIDILKDEDIAWIVASVRKLGRIDVLMLDPLRDVHGGEEDRSDSMRDVMRRLRVLGELLGCVVWVSHHTPKLSKDTAKRRPGQNLRGSSAIHGSIDSGIYVDPLEGDGTNTFRACVTSQVKSGRSAGTFELELVVVDDDHGAAVDARWAFSRDVTAKASKPETPNADVLTVTAWVRALNAPMTRTALRSRSDRPIPERRFGIALNRAIDEQLLRLHGGLVQAVLPVQTECNADA